MLVVVKYLSLPTYTCAETSLTLLAIIVLEQRIFVKMDGGTAAVLPVLTIAEIKEHGTKKLPRVYQGLQISPGNTEADGLTQGI